MAVVKIIIIMDKYVNLVVKFAHWTDSSGENFRKRFFFVAIPKVISCQEQTFHKLPKPCEVPLHPMPRLSSARPHPSLCSLSQSCGTEVILPMYACFRAWGTFYGRNLPCKGYFLSVSVSLCDTKVIFFQHF